MIRRRVDDLNRTIDTNIVCFVGLLLRQSGHSQHLSRFQEGAERSLVHVHFAVVDELDQCVEICECHILEYDHWMLAGCAL